VSVLYVTAPNIDEARRIAGELVEKHLVACVNLVPSVESVYRWKNK
jgi:periplasmic divalent cation tolerance protein